jgi:hypothetical protein
MLLYGSSSLHMAVALSVAGYILWKITTTTSDDFASMGQYTAIGLIGAGWVFLSRAIILDPMSIAFVESLHSVRETVYLPFLTLPVSAMLICGAKRLGKSEFAYSLAYQILVTQSSPLSILGLILAVTVIGAAFLRKERGILYAGVASLIAAFMVNFHYAVTIYEMNPWLTLGVIGGLIILVSSLVESNLSRIIAKVGSARRELATWT